MIPISATCLLAIAGAGPWIPAPQPVGTLLRSATILSDGAWVGEDTSFNAWISRDRGESWDTLRNPSGSARAWIFGEGVVVASASDGNDRDDRYDPPSRTWIPMSFDRKLVSSDSSVMEIGSRWYRKGGGRYQLAIFRSDSVLAFQSMDSARSWTSIVALPASVVPGGADQGRSLFAGSRFWLVDTVKRAFRSTTDGISWLEIPYPPVAGVAYELADSLPGGKWIVWVADSAQAVHGWSTENAGRTWDTCDISTPEASPGVRMDLSEGWSLGYAFPSGRARKLVRQGNGGAWVDLPEIPGARSGFMFVDDGRIYATGDSGLLSLDLAPLLDVRPQAPTVGRTSVWRIEGRSIVVTGLGSGEFWDLIDPSGRSLASGLTAGSAELRLPLPAKHGLFLLRIRGRPSRTLAVPLP